MLQYQKFDLFKQDRIYFDIFSGSSLEMNEKYRLKISLTVFKIRCAVQYSRLF